MDNNKVLAEEVMNQCLVTLKQEDLSDEDREKCLKEASKMQDILDKMEENDLNKAKLEMEKQKQKNSWAWDLVKIAVVPACLLGVGYVLDIKKVNYAWKIENGGVATTTATKTFIGKLFRK